MLIENVVEMKVMNEDNETFSSTKYQEPVDLNLDRKRFQIVAAYPCSNTGICKVMVEDLILTKSIWYAIKTR